MLQGWLTAFVVLIASGGAPKMHTSKAPVTPDFLQTDPEGKFADGGLDYCGPVAVSNSLVALSHRGYPRLRPPGDGRRSQILMIRRLASSPYMNTENLDGTNPTRLITGVQRYIRSTGYKIENLEYRGWRNAPRDVHGGARFDFEWIQRSIARSDACVWLNIGWYRHRPTSNVYQRSGGHWVTLVGYVGDRLIVHDPSPNAPSGKSGPDRVSSQRLGQGRLVGNYQGLPRPAANMYQLVGLRTDRIALLDGAVVCILK